MDQAATTTTTTTTTTTRASVEATRQDVADAVSLALLLRPGDFLTRVQDGVQLGEPNLHRSYRFSGIFPLEGDVLEEIAIVQKFRIAPHASDIQGTSDGESASSDADTSEESGSEIDLRVSAGADDGSWPVESFLFPLTFTKPSALADNLKCKSTYAPMVLASYAMMTEYKRRMKVMAGLAEPGPIREDLIKMSDFFDETHVVLGICHGRLGSVFDITLSFESIAEQTAMDYHSRSAFAGVVRDEIFHLLPFSCEIDLTQLARSTDYTLELSAPPGHYVSEPLVVLDAKSDLAMAYSKSLGDSEELAMQGEVGLGRALKLAAGVIRRGYSTSRSRTIALFHGKLGKDEARHVNVPLTKICKGAVLGPVLNGRRKVFYPASNNGAEHDSIDALRINFSEIPPGSHLRAWISLSVTALLLLGLLPLVDNVISSGSGSLEVLAALLLAAPSVVALVGENISMSYKTYGSLSSRLAIVGSALIGITASFSLLVASANNGKVPPLPFAGNIQRPFGNSNLQYIWIWLLVGSCLMLVINWLAWMSLNRQHSRATGHPRVVTRLKSLLPKRKGKAEKMNAKQPANSNSGISGRAA